MFENVCRTNKNFCVNLICFIHKKDKLNCIFNSKIFIISLNVHWSIMHEDTFAQRYNFCTKGRFCTKNSNKKEDKNN